MFLFDNHPGTIKEEAIPERNDSSEEEKENPFVPKFKPARDDNDD